MDHYETVERVCRDCGAIFALTPGEQRFFDAHGLRLPWRCRDCRQARRETAAGDANAPLAPNRR